ncbi:MAG: hypothetical protein EA398_10445 [Deltaproteobacteria bacterium]|nr:MAG: hypothetical protein EA398_10445 [Deltaproteobacteria bacterium]
MLFSNRLLFITIPLCVAIASCSEVLEPDLVSRDAHELVAVLHAAGMQADRRSTDGRWEVIVPRAELSAARALLVREGLPRVERFIPDAPSGLVSSIDEERARRLRVATVSLEDTLLSIEGVIDARVHAVLPDGPSRRGLAQTPGRSAVLLVHRPDAVLPPDEVIRSLVIGSLEGVDADRVTIVRSRRTPPPAPPREWVAVGPIVVDEASSGPLVVVLGGLCALVVLLSSILIVVSFRGPSPRRTAQP